MAEADIKEDVEFYKKEQDKDSEGEKEEKEDEQVYVSEDFISQPYLSQKCTLPKNIIEFDYSYGYDCKRYFNLCVIEKEILIFASGNIIHFVNASTGVKTYRRCSSGCGIGHIATNPILPHVAVGEKGESPNVIVYEWPTFNIITVLKNGTKKAYTHLNYSPDGELLCTQGDEPDYMLTIWNWKKHQIMLRAKAYGAGVFNAKFSLYLPGHLTTSGTSHIKFWKINNTFTGLKLQGELGRFGKTEICNIIGFLALPDEKVVSGSEWGNILVWDAGLIRVEVFRRGKAFCHEAPITQFIYNGGELTTVAMDGTIKIWYYETIELADPPEEERFIEVEPIFEYEIGDYYHKAKLMVIVKSDPDPTDNVWFGQDGNGGIWKLDLSTALNAEPPHLIFQCHAGHVVALQVSPSSTHFATLGKDGRLLVYDYKLKKLLWKKEFLSGGTCLLWLPLFVEASGSIVIGGFEDGVVRVICISIHEYQNNDPSHEEEYVNLIQVSKPHSKAITRITMNPSGNIVVTGSMDSTIFLYKIRAADQFVELHPIGFIPVTGQVSCLNWKPGEIATILVGCVNGTFMEIDLPTEPLSEDPITYLLEDFKIRKSHFVSVKSEIRRNNKIQKIIEERIALAELKKKEAEEEELKLNESVEEIDLEEIDESLLPEKYVPEEPSSILFAIYNPNGNVWLSMGGYDAGYIYEYDFNGEGPITWTMLDDADDIEIHSYHYHYNNKYLILGMSDGKIRVIKIKHDDPLDFSDYWSYSMHDNNNGIIYQISFSYNYKYMFTCGSDSNVFSYKFNAEDSDFTIQRTDKIVPKGFPQEVCMDIDDPNESSLEEVKRKLEAEHQLKLANSHKRNVLDLVKVLEKKYEELLKRNAKLPKSQQLSRKELLLDWRISEDLEESIMKEMQVLQKKLAYNFERSQVQYEKLKNYFVDPVENQMLRIYGIKKKDCYVETFRLRALGKRFEDCKKLVKIKLEEQELRGRMQARLLSKEEILEVITRRPNPAEALLKQILSVCDDYKKNVKLRRLLRKYRERKDRIETRRIEWHEMFRKKPNPDKTDPEDTEAIKLAKEFIGDYKLKTASDYKMPQHVKLTTVSMYDKLLKTREAIYQTKKNFNDRVLSLRERKIKIIDDHNHFRQMLLEIAKEIPKDKVRDPPELPTYDEDVEFPESKFYYTEEDVFEELPMRYKKFYRTTTAVKKEMKLLPKEYEMLVAEKKGQKVSGIDPKLQLMMFGEIIGPQAMRELEDMGKDDHINTPWEKEYRKLRVMKRLYQQDRIIEQMENDIKNYDNDLMDLSMVKYKTQVDVKLLEIYLLTVHQEVIIIKKFEAAENQKENKLFEKLLEKYELQKKINEIATKIEGRNREIRRCEDEIKNIVTTFHAVIADNKFYDFLRRIFKKKYRPPKTKTEDSESESESESSTTSGEEDAKSLDSKEIGPIRLDENVCPSGCDPQLYEWTFKQRSARHTLELTIIEEKKMIDTHRKNSDVLLKNLKAAEAQHKTCQNDLEEYTREKQRNLNEVETVIVLYLNQIQSLKSESELEKLSSSVLFSSKNLTNLYKRVGELEKETEVEKQKHIKNCQHLGRMKIDTGHMKEVIQKLNKDIEATMFKKFGSKIEVDDIEESLLKRLVADMHSIVLDQERQFEIELALLRNKMAEKERSYTKKVQENTQRHNLVAVLEEEKTTLQRAYVRQNIAITEAETEDEKKDLDKLENIMKQQEHRLCSLKLELESIKVKGKPTLPNAGLYSSEIPKVSNLWLLSFDGESEEIKMETRNQLQDIYDEALEIVQDIREGFVDKADIKRMKTLTEEFTEKLPEKIRISVIKKIEIKFKMGGKKTKKSTMAGGDYVRELLRELTADQFLVISDMIGIIVGTVSTGAEENQINIQGS